jgi:Na+-driven multidrug efflux pump
MRSGIPAELLRLGWPLALSNILLSLDSFSIRFWLGRYLGEYGLAAHTNTAPVIGLVHLLFTAIATGLGVSIARSVGARDGRGLSLAVNAMVLTGVVAVIVAVAAVVGATPVAESIVKPGLSPEPIRELLVSFLLLAIPLVSLATLLAAVAASAGWGRLLLIWGVTHVPPVFLLLPLALGPLDLGYYSPAFAVAVAGLINTITLWILVRRHANRLHLGTTIDRSQLFDLGQWRAVLDIGLPQQLSRGAAFVVMFAIVLYVGGDGVATLAGYGIAMIFVELAGGVTGGYARAAGILIAQSLGAKDPGRARNILKTSLVQGLVLPAATAGLLFILAPFAVALFVSDDAVASEGVRAVRLMVFALIPASLWQVLLSAFGAAKATKRAFLLTLVAQAAALGILAIWPGDRVVGALVTLGSMHGLSTAFYFALSVSVLWRGALAEQTARG